MTHRFFMFGALAIGALGLGACGDDGDGLATTPDTRPPSRSTDLAVTGTDSLRFAPDTLSVPAGQEVTLAFSAGAGLEHDFVVEEAADVGEAGADDAAHGESNGDGGVDAGDLHVAHADPGQTTAATFRIDEPGTYRVYCSVPGHREGGMLATLAVV